MSLVGFKAKNHQQQVEQYGTNKDTDCRATPPEFFAETALRLGGFTVDACALPFNTKLERFWSPEQNGLMQDWTGERVWCNPPYSAIALWVEKAWTGGADLVAMLLPANRTEQGWWQEHVEPFRDREGGMLRVEFIPGRMRFVSPYAKDVKPNERPPFGVCLLIFDHPQRTIEKPQLELTFKEAAQPKTDLKSVHKSEGQ